MKKILLALFILTMYTDTYSQELPIIKWKQGDLRRLDWGMSKAAVEQVLGVRFEFSGEYHSVKTYTVNLSTTWMGNRRIDFNCTTPANISFFEDKLFHLWFCTNPNIKSTLISSYGEGMAKYPSTYYKERIWFDDKTYMEADFENGTIWLEDWRINDKAYDRNSNLKDYVEYKMLYHQK